MEGINVRLSDGESWTLPIGEQIHNDPEFEALLAAAIDVEDQSDALRAELALTIFLLRRNYDLSPDQLALLLTFTPDDPALSLLQNAVHELVLERFTQNRATSVVPPSVGEGPRLENEGPSPQSEHPEIDS